MKHVTHNTKLIILTAILFFVACFMFYDSALAQYKLETGLPPIAGQPSPSESLPQYINYLFIFGLGAIAILALVQMMIGGLTYILAAGNVAKVEDAKETIQQALLGLGLLLVSYLLLRTINPDLVNLRTPNLTPTQFQGEAPKGACTPDNCPSECKTECKQGVWDDAFCGCKMKSNCDYSLVSAAICQSFGGAGTGPPMAGTPCEATYKSAPGLYKNSVCCEHNCK